MFNFNKNLITALGTAIEEKNIKDIQKYAKKIKIKSYNRDIYIKQLIKSARLGFLEGLKVIFYQMEPTPTLHTYKIQHYGDVLIAALENDQTECANFILPYAGIYTKNISLQIAIDRNNKDFIRHLILTMNEKSPRWIPAIHKLLSYDNDNGNKLLKLALKRCGVNDVFAQLENTLCSSSYNKMTSIIAQQQNEKIISHISSVKLAPSAGKRKI